MARCPDCNKFVSYDEPQVEITTEDYNEDDGHIEVEVRITLPCGECSTELKETYQMYEDEVGGCPFCEQDMTHIGMVSVDVEGEDRFEGKGRGLRHYYGAKVTCNFVCNNCKEEFTVEGQVEELASCFEDLA